MAEDPSDSAGTAPRAADQSGPRQSGPDGGTASPGSSSPATSNPSAASLGASNPGAATPRAPAPGTANTGAPHAGAPGLGAVSLTALSRELVAKARGAHAGRAAHMVAGGHETVLSQTVLALAAGSGLAEHDAPPEATLQVLSGRIALIAGARRWELGPGELIAIPHARHAVEALEDSAFLLSVVRER